VRSRGAVAPDRRDPGHGRGETASGRANDRTTKFTASRPFDGSAAWSLRLRTHTWRKNEERAEDQ
jgi:hypothetical protein